MHPILIQTKYFTLNTLWIFLAAAIIVGTYTAIRLSIKNGLKLQFLSDNIVKHLLWALVAARIFAIIQNYNIYFYEFSKDSISQLFYIWDKGLHIWGGTFGFLASFYDSCKKHQQDLFKWLDVLVPSAIVALTISHIGAFFDGTNYGHETSLPWGVNFENFKVKYAVPVHPTQIYAFIYTGALAIGFFQIPKIERLKSLKPGIIALSLVAIYNFFRFLEEFVRGDDVWTIASIRLPQIFALIIAIASTVAIHKLHKSKG